MVWLHSLHKEKNLRNFFDTFYGWTAVETVEDSEFDPVREAQEAFGITEP